MTQQQLEKLVKRAYRAARTFRNAAIDADACIMTYSAKRNRSARRLRDIAEIATSLAQDAIIELHDDEISYPNPQAFSY